MHAHLEETTEPRRFTRSRAGDRRARELESELLAHLDAGGGRSSHAELSDWATDLGYAPEEVDRCLVCAHRAGLVAIDVGDPPGSVTRTIRLLARD